MEPNKCTNFEKLSATRGGTGIWRSENEEKGGEKKKREKKK